MCSHFIWQSRRKGVYLQRKNNNNQNHLTMNTKKFFLFLPLLLALMLGSVGCSKDEESSKNENTYSEIVGDWELESISRAFGGINEIPSDKRDVYCFSSEGTLKVISGNDVPSFLQTGEYDFSYDRGEHKILINGRQRDCVVSNGTMSISGNSNAYTDSSISYLFKKR